MAFFQSRRDETRLYSDKLTILQITGKSMSTQEKIESSLILLIKQKYDN